MGHFFILALPPIHPFTLQLGASVASALVAALWAPLRRWLEWRRAGEGVLAQQLRHAMAQQQSQHQHPEQQQATTAMTANAAHSQSRASGALPKLPFRFTLPAALLR